MENNYQLSRIHNYVMGLMSREEMHALEKEALEDPFLQDALDGYRLQQGVDAVPLSLLQKRLAARVEQRSVDKNRRFYSWQRLSIGLVAAVMFVVVCSLVLFRYISEKQEKTTDVLLMEENYRVSLQEMAGSTAIPAQGWTSFNEELNTEIKDFAGQETIHISFVVDHARAKDIRVEGTDNKVLIGALQDFIGNKTQWQGKVADLQLTIQATP